MEDYLPAETSQGQDRTHGGRRVNIPDQVIHTGELSHKRECLTPGKTSVTRHGQFQDKVHHCCTDSLPATTPCEWLSPTELGEYLSWVVEFPLCWCWHLKWEEVICWCLPSASSASRTAYGTRLCGCILGRTQRPGNTRILLKHWDHVLGLSSVLNEPCERCRDKGFRHARWSSEVPSTDNTTPTRISPMVSKSFGPIDLARPLRKPHCNMI